MFGFLRVAMLTRDGVHKEVLQGGKATKRYRVLQAVLRG